MRFHISVFLVCQSFCLLAQQNLVYDHYFLNPYLYNPSYVAQDGYTELFLNYRQQWAGFNGAPVTGTLNLLLPLSYKSGLGFTFYSDRAGVLETNSGLASFAYQIYFGKSSNDLNRLGFGISAGVINSRIDLSKVDDPNDPSLLNSSTSSLDGQFGINYQFNNFKLGFSIPHLFASELVSEDGFTKPGIEQIRSTISMISYNFNLGSKIAFEPYLLYRTDIDTESRYEVLGTVKLHNGIWAGGAYRQDYGVFAFLGFTIKEKLKVGYAYEFAANSTDNISNPTHEFQLALRLGKNKKSRPLISEAKDEPVLEETITVNEEPEIIPPVSEQKEIEPVVIPEAKPDLVKEQGETVTERIETHQQSEEYLPIGNYVVVGAFKYAYNATNYVKTLQKSGYPAEMIFYPIKAYYIIHMGKVNSLDEARKLRDEYRAKSRYSFKDTWILTIE